MDSYRPARLDPQVPIEDMVGAMADLVKAGYVRHVGLSDVGADTIRRAHAVHGVTDVQNRVLAHQSLISRSPEAEILPTLSELGIGLTAYGVLSRGLLSGSKPTGPTDFRAYLLRFSGANLSKNEDLVQTLNSLAHAKGITASQLAIAWVLSRGNDIVPVIGARKRSQLNEALGAVAVKLSAEETARIENMIRPEAVAGTRYDAQQMRVLDSERARGP